MSPKAKSSKSKAAGRIRVKLVRGWAGKSDVQVKVLRGLGLRRSGDANELPDSPSVRGSIAKVSHLVTVVES